MRDLQCDPQPPSISIALGWYSGFRGHARDAEPDSRRWAGSLLSDIFSYDFCYRR
jgi:hypothetical protein